MKRGHGSLPRSAVAGMLLGVAGCSSRGCGHSRPYTPYAIDPSSSLSAPAPSGSTAGRGFSDAGARSLAMADDDGGVAFPHAVAEPPPEQGASQWTLGGLRLTAPSGEHFVLGLPADFDGDGAADAVAWVASQDPSAGRLLYFHGRPGGGDPESTKVVGVLGEPKLRAGTVAQAAASVGCALPAGLERIGAHTFAASLEAVCPTPPAVPNGAGESAMPAAQPGALPPSAPSRWIGIFEPAADIPLREQMLVAPAAQGETLSLAVDASDHDGDGRDDLAVSFALEGAPTPFEPGPRITAVLRWLDRPAGLSRDEDEPEASLRAEAAALAARAAKAAEAPSVWAGVRGLRRMFDLLCANAGAPAVSFSAGPVRCGTSRALEDATAAEVRAALASGDVARAIGAWERIDWQPATSARRTELRKVLEKAAPVQAPAVVRTLSAVPDTTRVGDPAWGPLMFDPAGELLVRTGRGVVRVRLDTGDESLWEGMPTWPAAVASGDDRVRWTEVDETCRDPLLHAHFTVAGEPGGGRDLVLPLLAPAPGRCGSAGAAPRSTTIEALGVGWGPSGLDASVAGQRVFIASDLARASAIGFVDPVDEPAHAGSPRSPDGRFFVWGTPLGVLLQGPPSATVFASAKKKRKAGSPAVAGFRLVRPADLEGDGAYRDLHACVVANGGGAIACIRGGRAIAMLMPRMLP